MFVLYSPKIRNLKSTGLLLSILLGLLCLSCNGDDEGNRSVRTSGTAHLYATTHSGEVRRYDINTGDVTSYANSSADAEGIFYSGEGDFFTIVSRSANRLETYSGINSLGSGGTRTPNSSFFGYTNFQSPRDLAVNEEFYVVSDNFDLDEDENTQEGRLFIYIKTDTDIVLRNIVTTKFRVWGVEFIGNDLYVAVDETNKIAVYRDFVATRTGNRIVTADKIVSMQGLVRTHGLDYDEGTMVITDIGEAESGSDGGLHIIQNFERKFENATSGGFIGADEQLRIAGGNTLLGNPVNVVYNSDYNVIFVAEALNNSGRILAFNNATSVSGNISPDLRYDLSGVSSLFFYTE